jgi:glycosyltransferase involved in cell wall biosynthesis
MFRFVPMTGARPVCRKRQEPVLKKLLFFVIHGYLPDAVGGSERSFHSLFVALAQGGWTVEVVCAHREATTVTDWTLGYRCQRVPAGQVMAAVAQRIDDLQPDLVMAGPNRTVLPLLEPLAAAGIPAFFYSRMIEDLGDGFVFPPGMSVIANSEVNVRHLARHHRHPIGLVPPTIDPGHYLTEGRVGEFVTFVNPIPVKGLEVAVEIARRLPEVPFLFVKGRWASARIEPDLSAAAVLPNVEIWPTQTDMRTVYRRTDILLFPSQWEETAGRVIIEAQLNGIPVVASPVGGVPAQVGEGGILVADKTDPAQYAAAIERLRGDRGLHERMSRRALQNSQHPRFSLAAHVRAFIDFVDAELERMATAS